MSGFVLEGFNEMAQDLGLQVISLSDAQMQAFMERVIGHTMVNIVMMRFLRGQGPNGEQWMSIASDTKEGGRWAASYRIRPSGDEVTGDKIRLVDTKQLMNSYRVLSASADRVEVGPAGGRSSGPSNEELAAIFEGKHQNIITGWDDESMNLIDLEMGEMLARVVLGEDITSVTPLESRA